jgi:hypothetical protein
MRDNEPTADTAATTEETSIEWGILFDVRLSIRYHSKRAAFFGFCSRAVTAISMLSSSAVIALVISKSNTASIMLGALIAVASTISLIFGWSAREHLHSELKIKFINLEKEIVKCETINEKKLKEMKAERLQIEAGEASLVKPLYAVCYNEESTALGTAERAKISWFHSLTCQWNWPWFKIKFAAPSPNFCQNS